VVGAGPIVVNMVTRVIPRRPRARAVIARASKVVEGVGGVVAAPAPRGARAGFVVVAATAAGAVSVVNRT
jgi:hypothetical protein